MAVAEIITIGTEILLGEIQDTNTRYLAQALRNAGVDLYRTSTVGDNPARITQIIKEAMDRADIIITTGGLGPTVDDPTRQAIANAVGQELVFKPELWEQIEARFRRFNRPATENNKRQAYIPADAIPVENPVGTAPSFIVETDHSSIISLPGVPKEMEFLVQQAVLPYIQKRFHLLGTIKFTVLHTANVGESLIDEQIGDLEELSNPTVGLAAHPGQIDIRVTAKADTIEEADGMIDQIVRTVHERLGEMIYGKDEETLEDVVYQYLLDRNVTLSIVEAGLNGKLVDQCAAMAGVCLKGDELPEGVNINALKELTIASRETNHAQIAFGATLIQQAETHILHMILAGPTKVLEFSRFYGSAPQNAAQWAVNVCLDTIRTNLSNLFGTDNG